MGCDYLPQILRLPRVFRRASDLDPVSYTDLPRVQIWAAQATGPRALWRNSVSGYITATDASHAVCFAMFA